MPPKLPAPTTPARVHEIDDMVLSSFRDKADQIRGLFFATDDDSPQLVTVPYREGTVSLDFWLLELERFNYFLSRPRVHLIGIKRHIFKKFPSFREGLPLKYAYSVYYWTQDTDMLVNRALAHTTRNAAPHLLVRGDVIVLKHQQVAEEIFEDMMPEDEALVCALLDDAVSHGLLDYVVDHEFNVIEIED